MDRRLGWLNPIRWQVRFWFGFEQLLLLLRPKWGSIWRVTKEEHLKVWRNLKPKQQVKLDHKEDLSRCFKVGRFCYSKSHCKFPNKDRVFIRSFPSPKSICSPIPSLSLRPEFCTSYWDSIGFKSRYLYK